MSLTCEYVHVLYLALLNVHVLYLALLYVHVLYLALLYALHNIFSSPGLLVYCFKPEHFSSSWIREKASSFVKLVNY